MQGSTSRETHFRYVHVFVHPSFASLTAFLAPPPRGSRHGNFLRFRLPTPTNTNHHLGRIHRLVITSDAFQSKRQPARHRMVYALLRDEMALEYGIHALQLRTLTPDEEVQQQQKKAGETQASKDVAQKPLSTDET